MLIFLIKMFVAGLISSLPAGPVGIFAIQQGLRRGLLSTIITFSGALAVDAVLVLLLLTGRYITTFEYAVANSPLSLIGPVIIVGIGYMTFLGYKKKDEVTINETNQEVLVSHGKNFMSAALMNAFNPAVIPMFIAVFTLLGIINKPIPHISALPLGVLLFCAGALSIWLAIGMLIQKYFNRYQLVYSLLMKFFGGALMIIGVISFGTNLIRLL